MLDKRKRAARRQFAARQSSESAAPISNPGTPPPESGQNSSDKKGTLLNKVNIAFHDAMQSGRGENALRESRASAATAPAIAHDDLALGRTKSLRTQRMLVPEDVLIEGSLTSASETEIYGRIEGDVTVNERLYLATSAKISGSIQAISCKIDGPVDGKVNCEEELELGKTGQLNQDAVAGKKMVIAGRVTGNVTCGGLIHVLTSAHITGNIRARMIVLDEGAIFNGTCQTMRNKI